MLKCGNPNPSFFLILILFFEEDKPVPKYWAKVSGLDKEGRVAANPEDNVELSCQAIGK